MQRLKRGPIRRWGREETSTETAGRQAAARLSERERSENRMAGTRELQGQRRRWRLLQGRPSQKARRAPQDRRLDEGQSGEAEGSGREARI